MGCYKAQATNFLVESEISGLGRGPGSWFMANSSWQGT